MKLDTININGIERPVYNSAGKRIAETEEGLRNFYTWFGDSKVVDEQGRPRVGVHYTNEQFDVFDVNKARQNSDIVGFFFSDKGNEDWRDMGSNKIFAYLKLENPIYEKPMLDMSQNAAGMKGRENLIKKGYDGIISTEDGVTEYVALYPEQIKSTENKGTYIIDNPDILN